MGAKSPFKYIPNLGSKAVEEFEVNVTLYIGDRSEAGQEGCIG